jgi:predicted phage terminase large subunit-like protein
MLQNPVSDKSMGFKEEWLKFYERLTDTSKWNHYLLVDPASKRKSTSDFTVMLVIALAPDNNYYLVDGIRDRLNLTSRAKKLFEFHRKYPIKNSGYEQYGAQADIEHMKYEMELQNYRFNITELGGQVAKEDRIQKLIPIFEQHRFWLPKTLTFINYEGRVIDLTKTFIEDEYLSFPVSVHDDMLDCMARIIEPDLGASFPKAKAKTSSYSGRHSGFIG